MITSVTIKNFRSIEDMELPLGKINVLTGANNSGKSSVIYALLVLKNAVTNPNQTVDEILNLGFINFGGIKQTVYRKDVEKSLSIFLNVNIETEVTFGVSLGPDFLGEGFYIKIPSFQIEEGITLSFPYMLNRAVELQSPKIPERFTALWNGITTTFIDKNPSESVPNSAFIFQLNTEKAFGIPIKASTSIEIVPIRRGFTKPYFSPVTHSSLINSEDEIATVLYADRELASDVAHFLEKIVTRRFSVVPVANTTNFYLQTRDEKTGFTADLVNEGLGTNQLVTILAKALYKGASFICIDEPEIHLHPSIIDKLVNVLIDIANERGKQFLISTHSEHFINSLLSAVVKKRVTPDDVKVYHLTKDGWDTKAELQPINEQGQIGGVGLSQFYAAELEAWSTFFGQDENAE